ncbi:sugar ABC transporter ATP-binding protein [Rhizobium sp. B230/85]|uniref:sugar ABC transporter ATP-binding protein n=1 Tax=unclassified Rhizobium TaxID=2613769 RepID=UPI001ADAA045|nr:MULTISPECIES: sugar ABC transporter ATP-binding protein [unclassified Rhizobium]MBO9136870.1 sugar ABC transporter ATP-binding protein [Rhizobium sp. B209b/85]QXZ98763.1 sugar ABC transporter ATP-binding protein [Rhizobium sp. B230/85]
MSDGETMLLEMHDIRKSFSSVQVLRGVDFSLKAGEIHALVGHNGAGKSTLMKILGGNYADYEGDIRVAGEAVRWTTPADALKRGVAIIYQDFSLIPDLSVAENIALGREPRGKLGGTIDYAALRKRSRREADGLGISLPMDVAVRRLGVGAQQLTEIVRACSQDLRILVMDEPTARLAPAERELLFKTMRRMANERQVGIIYISHFLDEVCSLADRITVMRDGTVVETKPGNAYTVESLAQQLVGNDHATGVRAAAVDYAAQEGRDEALSVQNVGVVGRPEVSFSIGQGEIVGLAGLVGSGRTRLARAIIGDVRSSGDVAVGKLVIKRRNPERSTRGGLVLVPEDRKVSGLALSSSIEANVVVSALAKLMSTGGIVNPGSRPRLAMEMIRRFVIRPPDRKKIVGNLSGGNAQKVLLGRAVASQPKVMILDQPTAGVDIGAKSELHNQIRLSAQQGAGIMVISDDLDELLDLSDRVLVLTAGAVTGTYRKGELTRASLLAAMSKSTAGN